MDAGQPSAAIQQLNQILHQLSSNKHITAIQKFQFIYQTPIDQFQTKFEPHPIPIQFGQIQKNDQIIQLQFQIHGFEQAFWRKKKVSQHNAIKQQINKLIGSRIECIKFISSII